MKRFFFWRRPKLSQETQADVEKIARLLNAMSPEDFPDPLQQQAFELVREFFSGGEIFKNCIAWLSSPDAEDIGQNVEDLKELQVIDLLLKLQVFLSQDQSRDQQNSLASKVFEFGTLFPILLQNSNFGKNDVADAKLFKREFLLTALQSNLNNIRGGRVAEASNSFLRVKDGVELANLVEAFIDSGQRACAYLTSIEGATFYKENLSAAEKAAIRRRKQNISAKIVEMSGDAFSDKNFVDQLYVVQGYLNEIRGFDEYLKTVEARLKSELTPIPEPEPEVGKDKVGSADEGKFRVGANVVLARFGILVEDIEPKMLEKYQKIYEHLICKAFPKQLRENMETNLVILMVMEVAGHDILGCRYEGSVLSIKSGDISDFTSALKVSNLQALISPATEKAIVAKERSADDIKAISEIAKEIERAMRYGSQRYK